MPKSHAKFNHLIQGVCTLLCSVSGMSNQWFAGCSTIPPHCCADTNGTGRSNSQLSAQGRRACPSRMTSVKPHAQAACGCAGTNGTGSSNGHLATSDATLVLEGHQFRDFVVGTNGVIDRAAFAAIWPRLRVLARCSPEDKYTIVKGKRFHVCPSPQQDSPHDKFTICQR